MAYIILRVKTNTADAEKGLEALKINITKLAEQLSTIKINKDLTAQITQLTKYYQSLATAGQTIAKAQAQVQQVINKSSAAVQSAATNVETLRKGYANLVNQLKTLETQYPANTFTEAKNSITENFKAIQELSKEYQQQSQELLPEQKDKLQVLSDQYKKLAADVAQYRAENQKIKASETLTPDMGDTLYRLQNQWASLAGTIGSISKYYPKGTFDSITQEITRQSTAVQGLVTEYEANNKMLSSDSVKAIEESQTALLKQKAAFEETRNSATNYHGTLRDLVSGFLKFQLSAVLVMKPLQAMQKAFESINETLVNTETVVVSLQRVLDETIGAGTISSELYQIAESLGQTFDNVQEIAQNFAKAGLSWQETLDATKAAVLALNVAELTAEESSEGLIAIMTQFGYEASELTNVIDVLNKAADKSAVDTQELLTALQKTGSYAAAANLSLEDTVSLISALSEATGASGSAMGNALKSLLAYTSKEDSLSTFASLSDEMENVVKLYQIGKASILDVWESLSKEMTSLSAEQANALSQWAENSGLETELGSELSDVYDKLTGVYDTAGTYRKNYFIALLNNFDEVQEVMDEISDAQGYTMEEQSKYMDTYEAKLNSLNAKWQELISDENGWLSFKKFWLDVANSVLTVIEYTGGLRTTMIALGTVVALVFGEKIISGIKSFVNALKAGITAAQGLNSALGLIGIAATAISVIVGVVQGITQAQKEARQETINAWEAIQDQASELANLASQYKALNSIVNKTEEQENQYANVQSGIIDLLGERANALKNLQEGTQEYQQTIEELTKAELLYYAQQAQAAANAAQKEFNSNTTPLTFSDMDMWGSTIDSNEAAYQYLIDKGIAGAGKVNDNLFYDTYQLSVSGGAFQGYDEIQKYIDELYSGGHGQSDLYGQLYQYKTQYETAINEYLNAFATSTAFSYLYENGLPQTQDELDAIVNSIMSATGATETWRDEIENIVITTTGFKEEIAESNDELDDQIKKIEYLSDTALENLVNALNEAKNAEEESLRLEEKKLAVLEAQQALEEAKNNRSVKVFNAATGQFEYQVDQTAVKDAEDDLQQALDSLNEYISDEAFDKVVEEIQSGNATNDSILAILTEWKNIATSNQITDTSWLNTILETIKNETGVDLTTNSSLSNIVDEIVDESINDPALTAKIFTPTSNEDFSQYLRNNRIIAESPASSATLPPIVNSALTNNTSTTNDNSITINGVKIGSDMLNKPLIEVLRAVNNLVPNKS